ncbi:MAG: hypothetical protein PHI23_04930 [Candidatus Peribacteraceae bacterium]|nr:hypothetical protein [Candidatus Peribacteraceae bacterium]
MEKIEEYGDDKGNLIRITQGKDGVDVHAEIRTLPPYTGGADRAAARGYAGRHGLRRVS